MSHWNYRICHMSKRGTYEVREVYYDDAGEPRAIASAELGGDTEQDIRESLERIFEASNRPVFEVPVQWELQK